MSQQVKQNLKKKCKLCPVLHNMNRKAATPTTQKMGREWVDNEHHHKRTQKERKNYYIIRSSVSNIPLEVGKQKKI